MSRSVWLRSERDRDEARNDSTIIFSSAGTHFEDAVALEAPSASFEDLFRQHYQDIRELLNRHPEPGLGLVAVSAAGGRSHGLVRGEGERGERAHPRPTQPRGDLPPRRTAASPCDIWP